MRDYELMYIVRPDLDEETLQAAIGSVERLVGGLGGEVLSTTTWGRRRLAYEVRHLRDGHYMLLRLRLEPERVAPLERALSIHETVFRHLLVVDEAPREQPAEDGDAAASTGDGSDTGGGTRQTAVAAPAHSEDEDGEPVEQPAVAAATEEDI